MTLGEQLVKLREAKGLSLEELAEETHIGPHVLKELECGDFSRLSAAIYGSGFVKILAKYYGIDATPLRETFEREYREWAAGRDAMPRPKAPPLKFGAPRAGASAPEARTEQRPAEERRPKTERRAQAAPAARPEPDPVKAPATEPESDLFGAPPPRQTPLPPAPPPVPPAARTEEPRNHATVSRNPSPAKERGKHVADSARRAWGAFVVSAGRVARKPVVQRVGVAVLLVAVAAWVCALFVGGDDPAGNGVARDIPAPIPSAPETQVVPVAAQPAPAPKPAPAPAPAPVQVAEVKATEPDPPAPRFAIVGSALTDNLLPPPDCYAE